MAKLVYDKTGRLLFTKEMKKEYTILMPQMLPIHFGMFRQLLCMQGYHVEQLNNDSHSVIDEGQKYVHNDTCYPAMLVIGQFIDAIKHGGYDSHKIALMITQTGGGCRASNYIHLLRKALKKANLEYIPVISVSFGQEKNPGFKLSLLTVLRLIYGMMYGDILMDVSNQVRPYEINKGETDAKVEKWKTTLVNGFQQRKYLTAHSMRKIFNDICADFKTIPVTDEKKIRVGVVGEIYVKFSSLGNNHLEEFLLNEGAEAIVPGLTNFMIFKFYNRVSDVNMFGGSHLKKWVCSFVMKIMESCQRDMNSALREHGYRVSASFPELQQYIKGYLNDGVKMGEGWLLTAEMLELIHSGTNNIICTQPWGCLPNHIVGKGMIRALKDNYPESNIVAIDYDPSATPINQENRIKLMLANGRAMEKKKAQESQNKTKVQNIEVSA